MIKKYLLFFILFISIDEVYAIDIYDMSLESLMELEVNTGSLTGIKSKYSPSAITTITQEQIQMSPTKNIAELLEQYVPGLVLNTHQEGFKIGLRGLIAAENYKLIILLNGTNITNFTYEGVMTEIDQWDMNDIERIEVVRGPGSVTYGTGAVAGVINIITKNSSSNTKDLVVNTSYNPTYRSLGGSVQYSKEIGEHKLYGYASLRTSEGLDNPDYYVMAGRLEYSERYVGKRPGNVAGPQPYLYDANGIPQMKYHINYNYKNFDITARYVQGGQSQNTNQLFAIIEDDQSITTFPHAFPSNKQISIIPKYKHEFNENLSLNLDLAYDSQEYIRFRIQDPDYEIMDPLNIKDYAFAQTRYNMKSLINYKKNKIDLVGGFELTQINIGAPWGKSKDYLWIQEGLDIVSSRESSVYLSGEHTSINIDDELVEVGNGINVFSYAFLMEGYYQFSDRYQMLVGFRFDKPNISNYLFSPRVSFISQINDQNIVKITGQRSQRMMPLRAQFLYDKFQRDTSNVDKSETVNSIELAYSYLPNESLTIDINAFYNNIDVVGYTGNDLEAFGSQEDIGFEFVAKYRNNSLDVIFNHSYLIPMNFELNEDLKDGTNRNNITFSDYYYDRVRDWGTLELRSLEIILITGLITKQDS